MTIFMTLLPILLKLVGFIIGKSSDNKEAKANFISLVASLEYGGMKSVSLNESIREQIEARKKQRQNGPGVN